MSNTSLNALGKGDKITVFHISEAGACTMKIEFVVKSQHISPKDQSLFFEVTEKGKRKARHYFPKPEHIVLEGHDLQLKTDMDFSKFWMNAQFNLVAPSREIALKILSQSLIPLTAYHKSHIQFYTPEEITLASDPHEGIQLYAEEGN